MIECFYCRGAQVARRKKAAAEARVERETRTVEAQVVPMTAVRPPVALVPFEAQRREAEGSITVRLRMSHVRRLKVMATQRTVDTDVPTSAAALVRELVERALGES